MSRTAAQPEAGKESSDPQAAEPYVSWPGLLAWVVLAIGLALTWLAWNTSAAIVRDRTADRFQHEVDTVREFISSRMKQYRMTLQGAAGIFNASETVTREEWRKYAATLQLHRFLPGVQGLAYSPMVKRNELRGHLRKVRAEGFPGYAIRPEGIREVYIPVVFIEPFAGRNLQAFGYDVFSDPTRRAAMEAARDSGDVATSQRVILVQADEKDPQPGFLMYMPIYRRGLPLDTVEQRRAALSGFVSFPFQARDLFGGILQTEHPNIDLELFDGDSLSEDSLLYHDSKQRHIHYGDAQTHSKFSTLVKVDAAGRQWSLYVHAWPGYANGPEQLYPVAVAVGGATITLLAFWIVLSLSRQRQRAFALAHEITKELSDSEQRHRALFEMMPLPMWTIDEETLAFIDVNQAAEDHYGYTRDEFLKMTVRDIRPVEDIPLLLDGLAGLPHGVLQRNWRHKKKDGTVIDVSVIARRVNVKGRQHWFSVVRDVTKSKRDFERLQLAASVFSSSQEGIMITDRENRIVDVNPAFTRITGYAREEVLGENPGMLGSGRQPPEFYAAMKKALTETGAWSGEMWNRRKSGETYAERLSIDVVRDADGAVKNYVAVFSDISQFKAHEAELDRIAHYDALTGVPNRRLLADRLEMSLARSKRGGKLLAVCYIDLDGFKVINEAYGHSVGDQMLIETAQHLHRSLRGDDTVARLGGDEFVLLLGDLTDSRECFAVLDRILEGIAHPHPIDGTAVSISASIGVAIYPEDDVDADTLLRHADQAMFRAKDSGKNCYRLFDTDHDRRIKSHRDLLANVRDGLAKNEFALFYQPKVDMRQGSVAGAEALIRWHHAELGLLAPAMFMPMVDNTEMEIPIGEWVIAEAFRQVAAWAKDGLIVPVSVNISGNHLQSQVFLPYLRSQLAAYPEVDPAWFGLEILETTTLEDVGNVSGVIRECQALGFRCALDDFGTGYSSLTYLRRLPAHILKIDQSFVRDMLEDSDDYAIVEAVVGLADAFDREVIAEGVETLAHGIPLLRLGCDLAQGYGIAKPMPAGDIPAWVRTWQPMPEWASI
ncbi:MAG: EAL domain-containing protein [Rhodocyclaceae bacterium]|nr:EAL domain-containing protein [Rhodocyclaceae bacterium]